MLYCIIKLYSFITGCYSFGFHLIFKPTFTSSSPDKHSQEGLDTTQSDEKKNRHRTTLKMPIKVSIILPDIREAGSNMGAGDLLNYDLG